jgi:hypothetical protein
MNFHLSDKIVPLAFTIPWQGSVFAMFLAKHDNMLVMIQMFVRAFMRLV